MRKNKRLTVIDFFCGAGGFSEGFRQMGFNVLKGYDYWQPAVDTYNHNFGTNSKRKNILDFLDVKEIESLPDTDIILGSPPCVSFSSSNKSGKADKSMGVQLTECFLRIIAVKKFQRNSALKAWFMENVVNSRKYLKDSYTFNDLKLDDWAENNGLSPNETAISLHENSVIINSADFGSFQARRRVISGEIVHLNKLIRPKATHSNSNSDGLIYHRTIQEMKSVLPSPFEKKNGSVVKDPQYNLMLEQELLTDHFYDTGIYSSDAKFSKHWKINHPYMGKMSFPENEDKPSRTITATRIANSRESIIYKSEINRKGNGEYRLPTVREAATIMGFPITYQFKGSEYTKWRLVGNAVCASVSRDLAKNVLKSLEQSVPKKLVLNQLVNIDGIENLNTFSKRKFDKPPVKSKGAKCRWHAFKDGNLTVTLSNFRIGIDKKAKNKWFTSIQYGSGSGFPNEYVEDKLFLELQGIISRQARGNDFLEYIDNGFTESIGTKKELQQLFENQSEFSEKKGPTQLIECIKQKINELDIDGKIIEESSINVFAHKTRIPLKQLYALYGINKIASLANSQ